MADTTISPNMNLPVPTVSTCPGPDWATDVNACLAAIDSHNHSTGQGVPIGVSGIDIDGAFSMNENNLTRANSVGFTAIVAAVTSLLKTIQVVSKDLYYIDGDGNSVRITQGGSVTGATGTITGLPSGTASAAFAGATFTFNSATNTKATMSVGPVAIGSTTANGKQTTIASAAAMPADLSLTLPQAAGAANTILSNDGSSNTAWSTVGSVLTAAGILSSSVANANPSGVSISSATNLQSLSLAAGTWILSGIGYLVDGGGSSFTGHMCINTTSASFSGAINALNSLSGTANVGLLPLTISMYLVTPSVTTTYYLIGSASTTITAQSSLTAVRIA